MSARTQKLARKMVSAAKKRQFRAINWREASKLTPRLPKLKTKFSKSLSWLEKYLLRVHKKMPTMAMPRTVRSFVPHPKKRHRTLGNCCLEDRSITLATHTHRTVYREGRKKRILVPLSHLEILQTFAHELSHLGYEEHGYEQEWYGRTIFNTFDLREPCPHCNGKGTIPARYENVDK